MDVRFTGWITSPTRSRVTTDLNPGAWHEPSSTNGFDDAIDESDSSITLRQEAAAPAAAFETPLR